MKISILRFKAFQVLSVGDGMKYVNVSYNQRKQQLWVVVFWILKIQIGVEWVMSQVYVFPAEELEKEC